MCVLNVVVAYYRNVLTYVYVRFWVNMSPNVCFHLIVSAV